MHIINGRKKAFNKISKEVCRIDRIWEAGCYAGTAPFASARQPNTNMGCPVQASLGRDSTNPNPSPIILTNIRLSS